VHIGTTGSEVLPRTGALHMSLRTPLPTALGRHSDGNALTLVNAEARRFWQFRYTVNGRDAKAEWPLADYTLAEARDRASQWRKMIADGIDPRRAGFLAEANDITFKAFADKKYPDLCKGKNAREPEAWKRAIAQLKALHAIPVAQLKTTDVINALGCLFRTQPKKAERLRWRLERLLRAALSRGLLASNPAKWDVLEGEFKELRQAGIDDQGQHASLPYQDLPALIQSLSYDGSIVARACEFALLVALRGSEVRGAQWSEFVGLDTDAPLWVVPRSRMKCKKRFDKTTKQPVPHVVPLSPQAVALLRALPTFGQDGLVFASEQNRGEELSHNIMNICFKRHVAEGVDITTHGARATFRTWASEQVKGSFENAERALDHVIGSTTARAYIRSAAFTQAEDRRELMAAWAAYALPVSNVVPFIRAA
jgi:integrase